MRLMKTFGVLLLVTLGAASALVAQEHGQAQKPAQGNMLAPSPEDQERYLTALSSARRKLFSESMSGLSAPQLEAFWSVYADYEKDKNALALSRVEIVKKYVESFGNDHLSDADVTEAIKEAADVQKKQIDLRIKYFNALNARIGVKAAGRFALTDDYVSTAVRLDWLNAIPFPGDEAPRQAPAK